MKKFDKFMPVIHHTTFLLAILFFILLSIVKFSSLPLFLFLLVTASIAYKSKPKHYTLKSYLTFGEDSVFVASREMVKLAASPVTNYIPNIINGNADELEILDVENFLDDLGVDSSIEGCSSENVRELFKGEIERINKEKCFYKDSKFEEKLVSIIVYDSIRAKKLEKKIKTLSNFVRTKLDELYKNKQYSVLTNQEKQKLKNEIYEDIRTRNDLPSNVRANVEYFAQEYFFLTDEKINKICNFIREIGPQNLKLIKECFLDKDGKISKIHHLHTGDYRYRELLSLEKDGVITRVSDISIDELLNLLHMDELEQISLMNGVKPALAKSEIVDQLLELPVTQYEIEEHLSSSDFFAISDIYYNDYSLLTDSVKYLAALASTEEFLNMEFSVYVDGMFTSIKKGA
jgi:hypothetical protein